MLFTRKYSLIRRLAFILAFAGLFGIGTQVLAEQQEPSGQDELFEMPLEKLMEIEIGMVYGASKYEQKTTQAPSSVTIITADDIHNYGYRSLADILRSATGFYTSYDRAYERVGVRGFSLPGDENTRVLILLDGNRMNENVRGHGSIGKEFILDVDLIDRVEIIRGPGSSLYGGNAIFGVINIITKKGKDLDGFELSGDLAIDGELAKYEAQKGRISYGKEFKSGTDFLASGTLYGRNGLPLIIPKFSVVEGYGPTSNDDEKFYQLFTKLSRDNLTFEAAYSNRDKVIPTAPLGAVFEQQFQQRKNDEFGFVQLIYDHNFSDESSMMARASYNYAKHRRPLWYTGETWNGVEIAALHRYIRTGSWWNTEVQFTAEPREKHKVTWGAEFQYNPRQSQDYYQEDETYAVSVANTWRRYMHTQSWGLYIQDEYQASENLTLNAGIRYDHYDLAGGSINPRFALIKNLSDVSTLKLLYGTAFRPPTLYELYYEDGHLSQSAAGTLEAETIETYEAVLEHYFEPDLHGSLSVFHYQLHDVIDRIDMEDTWENSSSTTKALGLEAELQKKWASGMTGRVSYSLVDTQSHRVPTFERMSEDGEEWDEFVGYKSGKILNSPSHLFKLNLHAPLVKDKVFAGFETQYVSGRKTILGKKTAGSFVANLTINCLNIREGMDCSFGIYNLFNQSYVEPAWADNELDVIPQDGRWFMFNLTYRF